MSILKRIISFVIVFMMATSFFITACAEEERKISLSKGKLYACGYTPSQTEKLLEAFEKGEPLTPFHEATYDDYNSPADENGLGDDTLLLYGVIREYVRTGDIIGFYLEQEDGNTWLVSCGVKHGVGMDITGNNNVFDNLSGKDVEVYCKYIGFSELYKLPTVDVTEYGGVFVLDNLMLIMTRTSEYKMSWPRNGICDLGVLIGAERRLVSYETPR